MPITINGSGTLTGISAGGLPDDSIIAADIAAGAVTTAKIADANITAAKLDGAQSGSAPIYAARAWVSFTGSGTVTINSSGNVSSITDNGVGDYTVNFTTALADANYCVSGFLCKDNEFNDAIMYIRTTPNSTNTSSAFRFYTNYFLPTTTLGSFDSPKIWVNFFR